MNGSVAAEQTPHLSHRDVHCFEIESFNPQLLKRRGEGGSFFFRVESVKGERRKDREGKREAERVGCTLQEEEFSQVDPTKFTYILMHN